MTRRPTILATAAAGLLLLAGCGAPGSGGGQAQTAGTATGPVCAPVAGDRLTVLTDDKHLQNSDNVVAAFNKAFADAHPEAVTALDTVAAALDTSTLVELNKKVDIDHQTSTEVAAAFVKDHQLTVGSTAGSGTAVVVGSQTGFSENTTLAEIYAAVLDSAGFSASTQTIGNRETYYPALVSGQIQVVPEYAATLADFVNGRVNGPDAASVATPDIAKTMAALTPLAKKQGLTVGAASDAQDQNAFVVTTAFATKHHVATLSQLTAACGGGVVLGAPAECSQRPFCQIGLEKTYGLRVSELKPTALDMAAQAVLHGYVTVGLVYSSSATLAAG